MNILRVQAGGQQCPPGTRPSTGFKRLFNAEVYKPRLTSERSFAWVDKFRALLIRSDRKDANFLGAHHIAFAMINLCHVFSVKV
jgi:transposase